MKVLIMLLHFSCNLTWVWKCELQNALTSKMTWTFISSHCFVLGSGSLHLFLECHYCWCNSVDQNCEISLSWGHCNAPVSLLLATLKLAQLFHPLKLSSTIIGNYVSNSSTYFLCPLPSPHPLSLLHCSSLHWMLVWVCVSCGGANLISATLLAKAFICISVNL
jgi:hypothetical protein